VHFADGQFSYIAGAAATVLGLAVLALLCLFLYRAGRRATA
jgi:hypothetical protein